MIHAHNFSPRISSLRFADFVFYSSFFESCNPLFRVFLICCCAFRLIRIFELHLIVDSANPLGIIYSLFRMKIYKGFVCVLCVEKFNLLLARACLAAINSSISAHILDLDCLEFHGDI